MIIQKVTKYILISSFIFIISTFAFGQNQTYEGFYSAQFFDIFNGASIKTAVFEVKPDGAISGTMKDGDVTLIFNGKVEKKGKFTAQTATTDGTTFIIKGKIPPKNQSEKVEFIRKTVERSNGGKQITENSISGFMRVSEPPKPETVYQDSGIEDTGKTFLKIDHKNPLFGKEWKDQTAKVEVKVGNSYDVRLTEETELGKRNLVFAFRMREGQTFQLAEQTITLIYSESNKNPSDYRGFLKYTKPQLVSGKIEIISENDKTVVFKLTNVRIPDRQGEFVQIDGFVYAERI